MDTYRQLTAAGTATRTASHLTGIARASVDRDAARATPARPRRRAPANALTAQEKARVLAVLDGPEFVDAAPAQAYAALMDRGVGVDPLSWTPGWCGRDRVGHAAAVWCCCS
jgi:putative transposase